MKNVRGLRVLSVLILVCALSTDAAETPAAGDWAAAPEVDRVSSPAVAAKGTHDARLTADVYSSYRADFQKDRARLASQVERLDETLLRREATLDTLRESRAHLQILLYGDGPENLPGLRAFNESVEGLTFRALQPLVVLLADFPLIGEGADGGEDGTGIGAEAVSHYISFLLPITLLLVLVAIHRFQRALYDRHLHHRRMAIGCLILLLPLSSFAQDGAGAGPVATGEPPLSDMLRDAEAVLGLTRVQRYIKRLSSPDADGRRIRISEVDLSATPFTYFDSVVGGSGEYHATLAALHLADENHSAAIDELRALADPATRYATKNSDPAGFESLVSSAAIYLMDSGALRIADGILRLHMPELRSLDSFEKLYPELVEHSLTVPAVALARQIVEGTSETGQLLRLAQTFYDRGSVALAHSSLVKALGGIEASKDLQTLIEIALARREEGVLESALETAPRVMVDLSDVIAVVDLLRDADRLAEAEQLLDRVVERTAVSADATVDGGAASTTQALTVLSHAAFERGMLNAAEKAAVAAIEPLSRAERSALLMPAPEGILAPGRVPEPDKLVSPLYLGLLYEEQGRPEAARRSFSEASRALVENLLETDGLYVPSMMNHLALLGSRLDPDLDSEELAQLNRVLLRLERGALEELQASQAVAVGSRQERIDSTDEEIAALQADIAAMEAQLEERRSGPLALAWSTALLILRALGLLALCAACAAAIGSTALHYAKGRQHQKGHAFTWKLLEGLGWIWLLSIFSAPLGLLLVAAAQFFLLMQERHERLIAVSEASRPALNEAAPTDDVSAQEPTRADAEAEQQDRQWRNVLQMLREV